MAVPARPVSANAIDVAWGQVVHDTAVAVDIQTGTVNCVHSSSQQSTVVSVTFARPFAAPPIVALGSTNYNYGAGASAPASATGFSVATFRYSGAATGTVPVHWIAIGPRA